MVVRSKCTPSKSQMRINVNITKCFFILQLMLKVEDTEEVKREQRNPLYRPDGFGDENAFVTLTLM